MSQLSPAVLNRAQSREVDRLAEQVLGIPSVVLMENAGRGVTDTLERLGLRGTAVICCGGGNNGGDGFVVARHLDLRGYPVRVLLWSDPDRLAGDARTNYQIIERCGLPIERCDAGCDPRQLAAALSSADWVVDALLGTGSRGNPRPPIAEAIEAINASGRPVLAVDLPSGLDCDIGQAGIPTVRATHTVTMVSLKAGFLVPGADRYTGQIHVVDIGAPTSLIAQAIAAAGASSG